MCLFRSLKRSLRYTKKIRLLWWLYLWFSWPIHIFLNWWSCLWSLWILWSCCQMIRTCIVIWRIPSWLYGFRKCNLRIWCQSSHVEMWSWVHFDRMFEFRSWLMSRLWLWLKKSLQWRAWDLWMWVYMLSWQFTLGCLHHLWRVRLWTYLWQWELLLLPSRFRQKCWLGWILFRM